ncbi:MAG: hypothetical protein AAF368_01740 [Planctomycetota bacterium]
MPSSIKMAREFGDDLTIIFVESQGTPPDATETFVWNHKWMGTSAMWTHEAPLRTGSNGLPNFALLSNTGEVLLKGHPMSMHKDIVEAVEGEIAKSKKAPEGTPKALKKAYKAWAKGDFAKAVAEARKVEAKGGEDGEAAATTVSTFIAGIEAKFARVDWMLENNYLVQSEELYNTLVKSTKGLEDVAEKAAALEETFGAKDLKDEMSAAKSLARIESKLEEEGFDDKLVKQLEKFVKKNADFKAGSRAKYLLGLANN